MTRSLLCMVALFIASVGAYAHQATTAERSTKPLHPAFAPVEDIPELPRVLLIGDSISMGYTLPTRELLRGKANVHRISANGGPTTRGLASIDKWLGDGKWDIIHFNWGIHDLRHGPDGKRQVGPADYKANLATLVQRLKQTRATLIFATTTPIPKGKLNPDRTFGDETEYNEIAKNVMNRHGVAINDLHAYIMPKFDDFHRPNDLHFEPEGSGFLAKKVADEIERVLAR